MGISSVAIEEATGGGIFRVAKALEDEGATLPLEEAAPKDESGTFEETSGGGRSSLEGTSGGGGPSFVSWK